MTKTLVLTLHSLLSLQFLLLPFLLQQLLQQQLVCLLFFLLLSIRVGIRSLLRMDTYLNKSVFLFKLVRNAQVTL